MRTPLCEIALKFDTDKCPEWRGGTGHTYTPFYHELFETRLIRNVLEIGICTGASLRMWAEYWPEADIYGLDIVPETMINEGRIHSLVCDQSSEDSLLEAAFALKWVAGSFDLIIDDGSHDPEHQILTAKVLTQLLAPGGLYVIEDVQEKDRSKVFNGLEYPATLMPPMMHELRTDKRSDNRLVIIERPRR